MKICRYLIAFALCLGMAGSAHAAAIDFNMNVLDPSPPGGTLLLTDTFNVIFSPCSAFSKPSAPAALPADSQCFEGINETTGGPGGNGETWTSLVITIVDTGNIFGNASCGMLDAPDSIFSTPSCSKNGNTYTLGFFGDGSSAQSIEQGQSFFIAVEAPGLTGAFPSGTAVAGTAVSPEPNSLVLLSSGTMMFGMLVFAQRRRLQRTAATL